MARPITTGATLDTVLIIIALVLAIFALAGILASPTTLLALAIILVCIALLV